jgi:hypothetical protein
MFLHDVQETDLIQQSPAITATLVLAMVRSFARTVTDPADRSTLSVICCQAVRLQIPHADT